MLSEKLKDNRRAAMWGLALKKRQERSMRISRQLQRKYAAYVRSQNKIK